MKEVLSVTELTLRIKFLLESNFEVFWVEGEVSNLRRPGSGHVYFTLKDETCQIRAVIFRTDVRSLSFELEDGMQVILRARLNVYEPRGGIPAQSPMPLSRKASAPFRRPSSSSRPASRRRGFLMLSTRSRSLRSPGTSESLLRRQAP